MNIDHLRYFLVLTQEMHYGRAAELLHLSQPAVSKHIQALEAQYGVRLFTYQARRLQKTREGDLLEQYAFSLRYNEEMLLARLHEKSKTLLRIGATKSIGDYILLPESPEEVETPLRIRPYSGLGAAYQTLSKYEIAVSRKAERGVGDVLRLCRSEAYYDVNGGIKQPAPEDVTALTVAALTDTKPSGWALDIYVSDELYADIIASEPATGIEIALTDPAMNAQVEAALRTHFAGAEYAVTNRQSGADFLREMSSGVYLLLGYIFAALFLFILLILYVRLCDYIEGSRPLIRSLYRLGASKRTLYRSYIRQDGISAAAAVAAPFLISLPLTALLCAWQKAPLHLDGGMLTVYAALAALLLFISGIILSSQLAKDARDFEFQLQTVHHWHSEKK